MAQQTRHGLYGGPRPLYGSFSGKVEAVSTENIGILIPAAIYRPRLAALTYRPRIP